MKKQTTILIIIFTFLALFEPDAIAGSGFLSDLFVKNYIKSQNVMFKKWMEAAPDAKFVNLNYELVLNPEQPVAGKETEAKVKLKFLDDSDINTIDSVILFYTADLGSIWKQIDLSRIESDEWIGWLPAFETGNEVDYSVHVFFHNNNMFLTVPCFLDRKNINKDYILNDCIKSERASCDHIMPRDFMMKMASGKSQLNTESGNNYKIFEHRIGCNKDIMTIDMVFINNSFGGSINEPTNIMVYSASIVNSFGKEIKTKSVNITETGGLAFYSPLGRQFSSTGYFDSCGYFKPGINSLNKDRIRCREMKNHLLLDIDRKLIEKSPYPLLYIYSTTGGLTDISEIGKPIMKTYFKTGVTTVLFTDADYFTVK